MLIALFSRGNESSANRMSTTAPIICITLPILSAKAISPFGGTLRNVGNVGGNLAGSKVSPKPPSKDFYILII
jgi:hypothetical protein